MKKCSHCKEIKSYNEFAKNKSNPDGYKYPCKQCEKEYRQKNKESIQKRNRNYHEKNKEIRNEKCREYYQRNKDKIKAYIWNWQKENPDKVKANRRLHKEKISETRRRYRKQKRETDPCFKLRRYTSTKIYQYITNKAKKNTSILNYLPCSIQEMKQHLESQFEPWMNWSNYGQANVNKKTWQIDHIIPQSKLPYDSMEHPNFQKCWALENLRPLDSIENIKKGNRL